MNPLPSCTADTRRHVLSSGLTVLLQRYRPAPVVAIVAHVKTGYFDEPDSWVGISHVLEHMFFKGTPRRGPGDLAREIKQAGGYVNAATSYDSTRYYCVLPADQLARGLDVLADAFQHSQIDAGELEREIEVIVQEARRKLDSPGAVVTETVYANLFDHHRIRRWRIGTEEELRELTRDDVERFYRTRYVPANTVLTIVGDIDEAHALELAEQHFGGAAGTEPERDPSPQEVTDPRFRAKTLQGDVQQTVAAFGWRTHPHDDPRTPALDFLPWLMSVGRGSLGYEILKAPGLVRSLGSANYTPGDVGVFQFVAEMGPNDLPAAVQKIWSLVDRVHHALPAANELDRAKALAATHYSSRYETVEGRATALATTEGRGGFEQLDVRLRDFFSVDGRDVQAAAQVLTLDRASLVAYTPHHGPGLPADVFERCTVGSSLEFRSTIKSESILEPRVKDRPETEDLVFVEGDNVDVVVARKSDVPIVSLAAVVVGPPRVESEANAGITLLTLRAALRGAGERDRQALAIAAEQRGGSLTPTVASDWAGWQIQAAASGWVGAATLLADVTWRAHLDEVEIEQEWRIVAQDAKRIRDDMYAYPIRLALAAGLAPDAYGLPQVGTPESVASLSAGAVNSWYAGEVQSQRLTVVAAGALEPKRSAEMLAKIFDRWPGARRSAVPAPQWRDTEQREAREKKQSALALAFPGPVRAEPDRFVAEIISTIASGLGGRFFDEIREKRALAYTVAAFPWLARDAGAIIAYVATAPERLAEARHALRDECRRFAEAPVSPDELARAIRYAVGNRKIRRQRVGAVLSELLTLHTTGDGLAAWGKDEAALEAVTRDDVARVATRIFDHAPAVGVIDGASTS